MYKNPDNQLISKRVLYLNLPYLDKALCHKYQMKLEEEIAFS